MSKIEWTEEVWNPVIGCRKVSPGCQNCYAVNMAHRHAANPKLGDTYHGLTVKHPNGQIDWSGKVKCLDDRLEIPLRRKKPTMYFVNSMSDLFHEDVPDEFIDRVFTVMCNSPQHTFQVLTKRPGRMMTWIRKQAEEDLCTEERYAAASGPSGCRIKILWPLPNVWLGVSVENQATADERIPLLLQTPAAIRFISAEPLLGKVDLSSFSLHPSSFSLDWLICGGESSPKARPMHPDWARSLRDQCAAANVPFFFKQWGEWLPAEQNGLTEKGVPKFKPQEGHSIQEGSTIPATRVTKWTDTVWSYFVGKARAGSLLDGVEHKAYPAKNLSNPLLRSRGRG